MIWSNVFLFNHCVSEFTCLHVTAFRKQLHIPLVIISKTMWFKLWEATPVKMTLEMFVASFLPEVSISIAESADQIIL